MARMPTDADPGGFLVKILLKFGCKTTFNLGPYVKWLHRVLSQNAKHRRRHCG
uniref:Uncharacterized protein n=1 Tax=uncultured Methanosarcinales archaeon TaxID=183757 RepID=A0A7H1KP52_9EURY|nr:hypothetical protein BODMHOLK_00006 [uncultured Methanosarcinales archaeon]